MDDRPNHGDRHGGGVVGDYFDRAVRNLVDAEGMMGWTPISSMEELSKLDDDDILQGYRDFDPEFPEPKEGGNRSRGYWHGWMNAARDRGKAPPTAASCMLAADYMRCKKSH